MVSGIFTLMGAIAIIGVSIKTFVDIFNYVGISAKFQFESFNIERFNEPLSKFLDKTDLSFKVKGYNFWDLQEEPLACTQFKSEFTYLIPNGTRLEFAMVCWEENGFLYFKIRDHNDSIT